MAEIKFREKIIRISIPICPDCGADMEEETNVESRTLWHYVCTKCHRRY